MRKFIAPTLTAGILAVFALFLPSQSRAVPLDVPNRGTAFSITTSTGVLLSSGTLAYGGSYYYQWCLTHVNVSAGNASNFTMYVSSMNTLTPSTTNFFALTVANQTYDHSWPYRTPYCAPGGDYLGLTDSVSGSTITVEGYQFGGWSQP